MISTINRKISDYGVSPVVGVILLVALVVGLVALVSVFAFNIGGETSDPPDATVQSQDDGTVTFVRGSEVDALVILDEDGEEEDRIDEIGDSVEVSPGDYSILAKEDDIEQIIGTFTVPEDQSGDNGVNGDNGDNGDNGEINVEGSESVELNNIEFNDEAAIILLDGDGTASTELDGIEWDGSSGDELWSGSLDVANIVQDRGHMYASMDVSPGGQLLYLAGDEGQLDEDGGDVVALSLAELIEDEEDAEEFWQIRDEDLDSPQDIETDPNGQYVYVGQSDVIKAFDPASGDELWENNDVTEEIVGIHSDIDYLYVVTANNLYQLDKDTGDLLNDDSYPFGDNPVDSDASSEKSTLALAVEDNNVIEIDLDDFAENGNIDDEDDWDDFGSFPEVSSVAISDNNIGAAMGDAFGDDTPQFAMFDDGDEQWGGDFGVSDANHETGEVEVSPDESHGIFTIDSVQRQLLIHDVDGTSLEEVTSEFEEVDDITVSSVEVQE